MVFHDTFRLGYLSIQRKVNRELKNSRVYKEWIINIVKKVIINKIPYLLYTKKWMAY